MNRQTKTLIKLFSRYALIILAGLGNLALFYKLLTPLTVNTLSYVLSFYSDTLVIGSNIYFNGFTISIIPACVAGSAFYLLFILQFSTQNIKALKRINILIVSFASLFIANITRMVLLVNLADLENFEAIHWTFYNLVSVVFVVLIWIIIVLAYKLKTIPIYSDLKYLTKLVKRTNKSKK